MLPWIPVLQGENKPRSEIYPKIMIKLTFNLTIQPLNLQGWGA